MHKIEILSSITLWS